MQEISERESRDNITLTSDRVVRILTSYESKHSGIIDALLDEVAARKHPMSIVRMTWLGACRIRPDRCDQLLRAQARGELGNLLGMMEDLPIGMGPGASEEAMVTYLTYLGELDQALDRSPKKQSAFRTRLTSLLARQMQLEIRYFLDHYIEGKSAGPDRLGTFLDLVDDRMADWGMGELMAMAGNVAKTNSSGVAARLLWQTLRSKGADPDGTASTCKIIGQDTMPGHLAEYLCKTYQKNVDKRGGVALDLLEEAIEGGMTWKRALDEPAYLDVLMKLPAGRREMLASQADKTPARKESKARM